MARRRTEAVSDDQVTDAIGVAVDIARDGDVDPGHRLNAVNTILGHAYDYDYPAGAPLVEDAPVVEDELSRG